MRSQTVPGTVVAVDFSEDNETLITVSVPIDEAWGHESVTIVRPANLTEVARKALEGEQS